MATQKRTKPAPVSIKALDDQGRIGGYLVVWGSPEQRDLEGEYFTPDTELGIDWYPQRPMLYRHDFDPALKGAIGMIDTMTPDDTGVWIEAQLDLRNRYAAAVQTLIERGVLGWSSGTVPHWAEVARDGKITRWPIVEGSLTPSPAEPRMTHAVAKHYTEMATLKSVYKSAGLPMPDALTPDDAIESATAKGGAEREETRDALSNSDYLSHSQEGITMSNENTTPDIAQMVQDQVAAALQRQAEAKAQAELEAKAAQADELAQKVVELEEKLEGVQQPPREPARRLPGKTSPEQGVPEDPNAGYPRVIVGSKFDACDPVDLAFGVTVMKAYHDKDAKMGAISEQYAKALAAKTWDKGIRPYNVAEDRYFKADELAHSTLTSYGDEWVPDLWNSELWRKARQDNVILPLFQSVEMPSNPFVMPIESTDPTVYYVPETTNEGQLTLSNANNPIPDSQPGSGQVQLDAKKLGLRVGFSAELMEDSIIPVLPVYREQAMRTMADAIDHVLLNGDTATAASTNINLNDGTPPSLSKYLALNGLRKLALVTNTANGQDASGAPTADLFNTARFLMPGRYSLRNRDLAWIVGDATYGALLNIDEFQTFDKYGPQATVLTGQIGMINGIPVLASAEASLTMADGKIDGTGNTKGQATCVYRPGWLVGYRRRVAVTAEKIGWADSYQLYSTVRVAFINFDNEVASVLYNITV